MYDTNGLTLNDLYPYGQQHGDAASTGSDLLIAPLLEPVNKLTGFPSHNPTATRYQVSKDEIISLTHAHVLSYMHYNFSFRL